MKINNILNQYKELEKELNISIDDVLNKITQEVSEILDAYLHKSKTEVYWEIYDAIINIYSVIYALWLKYPNIIQNHTQKEVDGATLLILLWKFNTDVQKYRWKYTRSSISKWEVESTIRNFVYYLFLLLPTNASVENIIWANYYKFKNRKEEYIKNLKKL